MTNVTVRNTLSKTFLLHCLLFSKSRGWITLDCFIVLFGGPADADAADGRDGDDSLLRKAFCVGVPNK